MKKILILNGPNLNLLGQRETAIYGKLSLAEIQDKTEQLLIANSFKVNLEWKQSNNEYDLVTEVQQAISGYDGLVINPGAFSHTSIAIHDALAALELKKIEVHLSNTYNRASFRSARITARSCDAVLEGLGKDVYYLGVISLLTDI